MPGRGFAAGTKPPEKKLAPGRPTCPPHLSDRERQIFRTVVRELAAREVLTKADGFAIASFAQSQAQIEECSRIIGLEGITATGSTGNLIPHPAVRMRESAQAELRRLSVVLGMNPTDRNRPSGTEKPKDPAGAKRFLSRVA